MVEVERPGVSADGDRRCAGYGLGIANGDTDTPRADHVPSGRDGDVDVFEVGGATLKAIHTPGHSPGSICFYLESEGTVFTGDTLFNGGPGATGRSYSDYPTILASIRKRLLTLTPETVVRTGHGDNTTIGAEQENLAKASQ